MDLLVVRHGFKNKQIKSIHHCDDHYLTLLHVNRRNKHNSVIVEEHDRDKCQFGVLLAFLATAG